MSKEEEQLARAVDAGLRAVENQAKLSDAALLAARAFDKLVGAVVPLLELAGKYIKENANRR